MKKNLALLHMREDLLQTDYSVSTHKTARPGRFSNKKKIRNEKTIRAQS